MSANTNSVEVVIPASRANVASFALFVASVLSFGSGFWLLYGFKALWMGFTSFLTGYLTLIVVLISGMIAHELLHALVFAWYSPGGWRAVSFGFDMKNMAPFTHCKEPVAYHGFIAATLAPGVILGLVPAVIAFALGNGWLLTFSLFFTAGSAGDILCVSRVLPYRDYLISDHPESIGFIAHRPTVS